MIPGPVRTQMTGVPEEYEVNDAKGSPILSIPGEWVKNPEDVVPLVLFLATQGPRGPTGQELEDWTRSCQEDCGFYNPVWCEGLY